MVAVFPVPGLNWLQYDGNNQTVRNTDQIVTKKK